MSVQWSSDGVTAVEDEEPHRHFLLRFHDTLSKPDKQAQTLLSGKRVHMRFIQATVWGLVVGVLLAPSFIAGLYWLVFEQHWYIHVTLGHYVINHGSSLKYTWDHLFTSSTWPDYRHAMRNYIEPAAGALGAKTLMAKSKYWDEPYVDTWRLITTPPFILVLALVLAVTGTWVIDFGMPSAWAEAAAELGHPGYTLNSYFTGLGNLSVSHIALGIVIGLILHPIWAPVGATLQGFALDRAVDRSKAGTFLTASNTAPVWERWPFAPPVLRERFAMLWRKEDKPEMPKGSHRRVITAALMFIALVTIIGILARFVIPHGIHIPYMSG